jgi:ceramide glucosyltransferase
MDGAFSAPRGAIGMTALVVAWALLALGFTVVTLRALARPHAAPFAEETPPILLLRPADAPTPLEQRNLATPVDYTGPLEQVVLSPAPPVLPPGVRWVRSDPASANRKVGHLLHGIAAVPPAGRIVVAVDADVLVDGALLAALAAPIAGGAALASAAPSPQPAAGIVPTAVRALLRHTHQSFVALDAMAVGAHAICGKAMALGPVALDGLAAVPDRLGEDLELAKWLHARGERVALAGVAAVVPQAVRAPLGPAHERFTRWMQVLRAHRPALYPMVPLLFTPSLPVLVFAVALGTPAALAAVVALWAGRTALAWRLDPLGPFAWPLGEALLLSAFVRSLGRRTVVWRGRRFRLARDGRMEPLAS